MNVLSENLNQLSLQSLIYEYQSKITEQEKIINEANLMHQLTNMVSLIVGITFSYSVITGILFDINNFIYLALTSMFIASLLYIDNSTHKYAFALKKQFIENIRNVLVLDNQTIILNEVSSYQSYIPHDIYKERIEELNSYFSKIKILTFTDILQIFEIFTFFESYRPHGITNSATQINNKEFYKKLL
jgi:hypothetical protein